LALRDLEEDRRRAISFRDYLKNVASGSWAVEILPKAQRALDSFQREDGDHVYEEVLGGF